jgi:hypothetical protein
MCLFSYFWNSENHLYWFVFSIDLGGGIIDLILCVITIIILRKELSENDKNKVELMVESGAAIVALLVIVTVLGMARLGTLQEHRIGNEITSLDWRKQPIYAFEATAIVFVRSSQPIAGFENIPPAPWFPPTGSGTAFLPYNPKRLSDQTWLYWGKSWEMAKGPYVGKQAMVASEIVEASLAAVVETNTPIFRFDIRFHANSLEAADSMDAGNDFDAIDLLVPVRGEVEWGQLKMSFDNGLTNRFFRIPKQKTFGQLASSVETNGDFIPLDWDSKIRQRLKNQIRNNDGFYTRKNENLVTIPENCTNSAICT